MYLLPKKPFSKSSTGHVDFNFETLVETFCQKLGFAHSKSTNSFKIMFFLRKKPFLSKCFSQQMACSFDISDVFVSPETRNILAQSPKVWKPLVLLEKCNSESSPGHLECLPDETGVFLRINVSPENLWKNLKLYLYPTNYFFKMFFRSLNLRFSHPCRKRLPTSGICSFKISKQSQNYFFWKKLFV